eukprot:GHUV01052158.1.p1 GENE.GHUV01052158.1~~GHUV01052158.1.p1  ORF type:complete len:171 (+),score=29.49 GHUV01052158.1:377-889(+)
MCKDAVQAGGVDLWPGYHVIPGCAMLIIASHERQLTAQHELLDGDQQGLSTVLHPPPCQQLQPPCAIQAHGWQYPSCCGSTVTYAHAHYPPFPVWYLAALFLSWNSVMRLDSVVYTSAMCACRSSAQSSSVASSSMCSLDSLLPAAVSALNLYQQHHKHHYMCSWRMHHD